MFAVAVCCFVAAEVFLDHALITTDFQSGKMWGRRNWKWVKDRLGWLLLLRLKWRSEWVTFFCSLRDFLLEEPIWSFHSPSFTNKPLPLSFWSGCWSLLVWLVCIFFFLPPSLVAVIEWEVAWWWWCLSCVCVCYFFWSPLSDGWFPAVSREMKRVWCSVVVFCCWVDDLSLPLLQWILSVDALVLLRVGVVCML